MAAGSSVQDELLKVTVVGCCKLTNKEWIGRQDPYVVIEYSAQRFVTTTCTDGGRNPSFNESYQFELIDSVRELNVNVWNSNKIRSDDYIGSTKIPLKRVIESGYDDTQWSLTNNRSGKSSGLLNLILLFARTNRAHEAPAPAAYPGPPCGQAPPPYGTAVHPHYPPQQTHTAPYGGAVHPHYFPQQTHTAPYGAAVHPHYPPQQTHTEPFGGHGPPPPYMYQVPVAAPYPPQSANVGAQACHYTPASAPPLYPPAPATSAPPLYPPAPATSAPPWYPAAPATAMHPCRWIPSA